MGGQGGGDGGPRDAVASYSRLLPPWKARALVPASIVCGAALADFDQVQIAGRPQRGWGSNSILVLSLAARGKEVAACGDRLDCT